MRDNGMADWPDPNPDGTYTIPARLSDPAAETSGSPRPPAVQGLPARGLRHRAGGTAMTAQDPQKEASGLPLFGEAARGPAGSSFTHEPDQDVRPIDAQERMT
jgi:hypothetical protein